MSMKEKLKAVQAAVSAIEKQFGKGAIMALGQEREVEPVLTIVRPGVTLVAVCIFRDDATGAEP